MLGLDPAPTPELTAVLAGNQLVAGMAPYAACYGGHQFGTWAGQLGDGRAITLGEIENETGDCWELQLKGAGPTPYSRHADGRAVLRSSLREFVASEAMFHLGVPTTRALSLVSTGDAVVRDLFYDGHPRPEPGAIVARVAPTFLRFGSYELATARRDPELLRRLLTHTFAQHFPGYRVEPSSLVAWFSEVARRTAKLLVHWLRVGFVHGVLNTDNMSILGLTIDYGPYGWLDPYEPSFTPNTTDLPGRRYSYEHQRAAVTFNLSRLATALLPLVGGVDELTAALEDFQREVAALELEMRGGKLGFLPEQAREVAPLTQSLERLLTCQETDYTLIFRQLSGLTLSDATLAPSAIVEALSVASYADAPQTQESHARRWLDWVAQYQRDCQRLGLSEAARQERMNGANPLYVPRNYLLVEAIDALEQGDRAPLQQLMSVLQTPYAPQPAAAHYAAKRPEWARHRPGCSLLSCSS